MRRAELSLGLVWLASATPLFLPLQSSWDRDLSLGALALLPWLAWASLPRAAQEARTGLALAPWLALPLAVLALALDRARELGWGASLVGVLGTGVLAVAFAWAALRSARVRRGRVLYASAWFTLVLGAPTLRLVLESVGAPLYGAASSWIAFLARTSPFAWWASVLHAPAAGELPALPWWPLALALLLALGAGRARAEGP